ncbi:MAG TPA: hypothetical protein VNT50_04915, partial [Microbacterium sp.]|uniref:hypothetical protein n=1 Tax=Microbacterium sp. TaxID=51671 RepID=UPI002C29D3DA
MASTTLLLSAAILAACTEAPPSSQPQSDDTDAATSDYAATLEFTGATAGTADDSLEPIRLGMVNLEGGVPSSPETREAAEAAVNLVNSELGGIGGHPLELDTCTVASSEEEGLACGQQMVNDPSIAAVVEGALVFGADSFHQAIDGKLPVVEVNPSSAGDLTSENAFSL